MLDAKLARLLRHVTTVTSAPVLPCRSKRLAEKEVLGSNVVTSARVLS